MRDGRGRNGAQFWSVRVEKEAELTFARSACMSPIAALSDVPCPSLKIHARNET